MEIEKYLLAFALKTALEVRKVAGVCAICKHAKAIDIDGDVDCVKNERKTTAKLWCEDFEVREVRGLSECQTRRSDKEEG